MYALRFVEIEGRRALEVESKRKGDRPLTFSARRDRVRSCSVVPQRSPNNGLIRGSHTVCT